MFFWLCSLLIRLWNDPKLFVQQATARARMGTRSPRARLRFKVATWRNLSPSAPGVATARFPELSAWGEHGGCLRMRNTAQSLSLRRTSNCWSTSMAAEDDRQNSLLLHALMTRSEVARTLGVSEATIRREIADGRLAIVKIRGAVRIDPKDLQAYIDGAKVTQEQPWQSATLAKPFAPRQAARFRDSRSVLEALLQKKPRGKKKEG